LPPRRLNGLRFQNPSMVHDLHLLSLDCLDKNIALKYVQDHISQIGEFRQRFTHATS
jgi:hypothetical protein